MSMYASVRNIYIVDKAYLSLLYRYKSTKKC